MSGINRRTFVTTGVSLLATSASLMLVRGAEAATHDASTHPAMREPAMDGHQHNMGEEMQQCIQLCHDCQARCIQLIHYCLTAGGRHAAAAHIRLLMDCAQLCTVTADFMARGSAYHDHVCGLCAELCRRCAESCEQIDGENQSVKQCAEFCRRCAESCERMASHRAA